MERFPYVSVIVLSAAALFACHLGMFVLPSSIAGLPTPILLLAGLGGSVAATVRWL